MLPLTTLPSSSSSLSILQNNKKKINHTNVKTTNTSTTAIRPIRIAGRYERYPKIINQQMTLRETIFVRENCLPWYYKQRMLFQLSDVRRRLLFLIKDAYIQTHKIIKPSTIPVEFKKKLSTRRRRRIQTNKTKTHFVVLLDTYQKIKFHVKHNNINIRFQGEYCRT